MTRRVVHEALSARKCKCGATFKNEHGLDKHLRKETGGERVAWINTPMPRSPAKEGRR